MSEWLLIVTLWNGAVAGNPTLDMMRLPTEQACHDAGEAAKGLWSVMTARSRYACVEIKSTSPRIPK